MEEPVKDLIRRAYSAFNARDVDTVLLALSPDVRWSNGWEGGYVIGHEGVRNYWNRQWKELDPYVEPLSFKERQDGQIEVEVHQKVKDVQGKVLFDGIVKHIYRLKGGLIQNMEIENL
jgi:nuclear transport factor 2 (NTF2) superfamily protein